MKAASVCVFCGSRTGGDPSYAETARDFGTRIARAGLTLVYGGGNVGLMGVLADAALQAGGRVVGVIPEQLVHREEAHQGISEIHVVASMHERKALMAELADGFAAMPGGIGTLDEFFEIWTWAQLDLHAKPYGLLNADGFFDSLIAYLRELVDRGFLKPAHFTSLLIARTPERFIEMLVSKSAGHQILTLS